MIEARTDVVGSLLRPADLLEARERRDRGLLTAAQFKRVEDAVDAALRLQEEAGLDVVTDGEMRRLSFQSQMTEAVEGFGEWDLDAFLWGEWHSDELGEMNVERPPLAVESPLRRMRFLSAEEFTYARGRTDRVLKVTLPSPSMFANFWDPERSTSAYSTLEEFLGAVAEILREEVDELVRLGATYIQLDALTTRCSSTRPTATSMRAGAGRRSVGSISASSSTTSSMGSTKVSRSRCTCAVETRQADGSSRAGTTGWRSVSSRAWERIDSCSSTTTSVPARSSPSARFRRKRSPCWASLPPRPAGARRWTSLLRGSRRRARSARSSGSRSQCGFATSVLGNALTVEEQTAKLRTIAETAARVWG